MKLSIYNTYLHISANVGCIYNALSDKAVVFYGDSEEIKRNNELPQYLQGRFIESGILVEEDKDEYACYIDKVKGIENDTISFHLLINPTLNCNFHCHYCYESHHKSKMSPEILSRVKQFIASRFKDGMTLTMSFFGGEPMLYYDDIMKPLIIFAEETAAESNSRFSCNMTSNGYLLDSEKVIWLREHSFTNAQITLDGQKETHNKIRYRFTGDNTYDRIVGNIKLLVKNGISVTLRLNSTARNIQSLSHIPDSFGDLTVAEKKRIFVDIHAVWQEQNKKVLISQMDTIVDAFSARGIPASKMDFRGFCYADRRNSCLINYNGDVYKCTARDFSTTHRDGYIDRNGEVIWENDSLERRMRSKFKNGHCRKCRIFPLCHGGCSTNSLENDTYCMHNFDEAEKDMAVRNRILHNTMINSHE